MPGVESCEAAEAGMRKRLGSAGQVLPSVLLLPVFVLRIRGDSGMTANILTQATLAAMAPVGTT
jgi:hypothetical protein